MKKLTVGILAHVDAGKTTLTEALLYSAGMISRLGRVDKKDTFLDTYSLERERGITIFSKLASLTLDNTEITLVDTPGHIDFSCEAERALSIQDYAILVISASDGIQAHTKTLWQLLSSKRIPTFIFVNKTDITEKTRAEIMADIRRNLTPGAADFSNDTILFEDSAGADERLMQEYFDTGSLEDSSLTKAIFERRIFPCFFGSALKNVGVSQFLYGFDRFTETLGYNERLFGARIFKIARDKAGKRMTYMKITGGALFSKDTLTVKDSEGGVFFEKAEEIRIYSGEKFKAVREARGGTVCAVLGPSHTEAGMGLGFEKDERATLRPVLDYKMILPSGADVYEYYLKFLTLTEEDPALALTFDTHLKEIRVRLMGDIQLEVLKRMIEERFGISVNFGEGNILYKETVAAPVRGAGHFEPLRHYAEVHLLIEPLPTGSGIVCESDCSQDVLGLNWQRLVITHLEERSHKGVLTGSPLTDVKITLTAGKAHLKHTEGGDFRQATYRAVRQALMKAESVLLEPTFDFKIELPSQSLGRLMTDITAMHGKMDPPETDGEKAILTGSCPVLTMRSYATELRAYTKGEGRISLLPGSYLPAHNAEEVVKERGYDPLLDERHTPNSVFCKAGAGYVVPWDEADEMMHLNSSDGSENKILEQQAFKAKKQSYKGTAEEDRELMNIFEKTYGKIKKREAAEKKENASDPSAQMKKPKKLKPKGDDYVIIDGYNFIFASESLKKYASGDLALARDTLTRLMCDYSSFRRCKVIIVFDAYKRKGGEGSIERVGDVTVVYTKEAETADAYIERTTHDIANTNKVRVVTSDMQEQLIILGSGGLRVSAKEFEEEIKVTAGDIRELIETLK